MRIIKDATAREYTCTNCNSILEVNSKDVHYSTLEYDKYKRFHSYYICPCCGSKNIIKPSNNETD